MDRPQVSFVQYQMMPEFLENLKFHTILKKLFFLRRNEIFMSPL